MAASAVLTRYAALTALVGGVLVAPLLTGPATANPANPPLADTERTVEQLEKNMVRAAEDYNAAKTTLAETQRSLDELMPAYDQLTTDVAKRQGDVDAIAAAAYLSGGVDPMVVLLSTGTPQTALDQLSLLQILHQERQERVDELSDSRRDLAQRKNDIEKTLAEQSEQERIAGENQSKAQQDLAKWEKLHGQLTGRSSRQAQRQPYQGQGAGLAALAVRFAYEQQNKPYEFASAGPRTFDCSGLTKAAWAYAGVSMPHSARAQFEAFPQVSMDDLQPGDLVFYGDPIYHVALYIGDGNVIHAPEPGDVVRVASVSKAGGQIVGAVRPG